MLSYTTREPYGNSFDGAVVYCSDGRFCRHVDEFLDESLGMSQCDRLVVPGGAARLIGVETGGPADQLLEDLRFLVTAHDLDRVVLIAHEGCAFYSQVLGIPETRKESVQMQHLATAAERVREMKSGLRVETYFVRLENGRVRFSTASVQRLAVALRADE